MTRRSLNIPVATTLSLVALLLIAPAGVRAESTVVTYQVDGALSPGFMESAYNTWLLAIRSPNVQVRYSAIAVNEATGESVCGAVVPVGTKIRLRYPDLQDHDITWNATGGDWDTPYGYWKKDAAFPGLYCAENDYSSHFISQAWGSIRFYTPYSVAPPSRSISIANDNISCEKSADGSEICTAM